MVDYNELRKKFPTKNPQRKKNAAAIKAISREYERKRAELNDGLKAPVMKKGLVFYAVLIIGLLMVGSLVLSATGKGGRAPISRAQINVRKSIDALAVALGRYRYHVGTYPTTAEGLEQLASKTVRYKGWNGPYIRQVVKDPWGHDYVYVSNGEAANPTLYSKGPDGLAGTTDDVLPDSKLFDAPFRDTSWTKDWMPHHLRGYVLAPDARTKKILEAEVKAILTNPPPAKLKVVEIPKDVLLRALEVKIAAPALLPTQTTWNGDDAAISLLPHWNGFTEGQTVALTCRANGDEAELFLNGKTQGKKATTNDVFTWDVPYAPGELKVIISRGGTAVADGSCATAGAPTLIRLTPEKPALADGDWTFVKVEFLDDKNRVVPSAEKPLTFTAKTNTPCVALASEASAKITSWRTYFILQRTTNSGLPAEVQVTAPGLPAATLTVPRTAAD